MYAYIKGELADVQEDCAVIEAGGIGYRVFLSVNSLAQLPPVGQEVKIYTYLQVREDAMVLFGFLTKDDLELFKMLITVSGIGPKGGLAILSTLTADDLRFAVLSGDSKAISRAPGIGAKTAQRLILELKDKFSLEDMLEPHEGGSENTILPSANSQLKNDAVAALTALGYTSTESLHAVSTVSITEEMDVEDVLKAALKHLL
ncbi:MAG: Holliday junction branch migration protein RuvA [Clostridiales bacterium]|nr:Holliday junction branch migration protein RuvA [Clostridiales bacterium]